MRLFAIYHPVLREIPRKTGLFLCFHGFFRLFSFPGLFWTLHVFQQWKRLKPTKGRKSDSVRILEPEFYHIPPTECGDLLSICVLPKWRGAGIANELISDYQDALRKIGRSVCFLTVATVNSRGIHFYEKNGFVPYRALGDVAITYAKRL